MKTNKKVILCASIAASIFAVMLIFDQISKHFIVKALPNVGDSMNVLPGFINFVYVQNTGAAWGIFSGRSIFLIITSLLVLGLYIWFFVYRLKKSGSNSSVTLAVSVGLIGGGCIGNLVDRLAFGYVRDFINFQFMDFPVFNVADISLTIGIIVVIVYLIFLLPKEDKKIAARQSFINRNFDDEQSCDSSTGNFGKGNLPQNNDTLNECTSDSQKLAEQDELQIIQKKNDKNVQKSDKNHENTKNSNVLQQTQDKQDDGGDK